jgi:hypothetical protein
MKLLAWISIIQLIASPHPPKKNKERKKEAHNYIKESKFNAIQDFSPNNIQFL